MRPSAFDQSARFDRAPRPSGLPWRARDQRPSVVPAGTDSVLAPGLPILVAASLMVVLTLMHETHMAISPFAADDRPYYAFAAVALAMIGGFRSCSSRIGKAIGDGAHWSAMFAAIVLLGVIASYPAATGGHRLVDGSLAHIDRLLHFDWVALYRLVATHPALQVAGRTAYESIYVSPAILLGYFAWNAERCAAHRFLVGFWLAAALTLALFPLMPAVGPLASLWHGPVPYLPASALWEPTLLPELRRHLVHQIDLGALCGLVSAPSFHTEAAILYIAAGWPHRALRAPLTVLNLAMLLATPVEGTHYLADMLIGALVAGLALAVVRGTELGMCRRTMAATAEPIAST